MTGLAEFRLLSSITLHLVGGAISSNRSQVTPLAEQFEMVLYVKIDGLRFFFSSQHSRRVKTRPTCLAFLMKMNIQPFF